MRILFIDPEDSPVRGPWSRQKWDLIVDLGKSSQFSEEAWSRRYGCRILRRDSFGQDISDPRQARQNCASGRQRLVDQEGIDWWDLVSLLVVPEVLLAIVFERMVSEIPHGECRATRRSASVRIMEALLGRSISTFEPGGLLRRARRARHYIELLGRFSRAQFAEIFLDKYDSAYRWRSRFAERKARCESPVILIPSAYGNVSRMAYAYARLLPAQRFLMIATRASAKSCVAPANVEIRDLAAYAKVEPEPAELRSLLSRWLELKNQLADFPFWQVLIESGVLDPFPTWIRDGLYVRDAWCEVLEREPVQGVLCGDDSNLYTRLPVVLARARSLPTLDFHHGAMDGRYVMKELVSDLYLAKNDMEVDYLVHVCNLPEERIVIGAPPEVPLPHDSQSGRGTAIVFFSEPYEVAGMRTKEVYREILPFICRVARENGRRVVVKLHPFESRSQRRRILREVLAKEDECITSVVDGPLTSEVLEKAWCGLTVESTTVIDCVRAGICCFLCRWLSLSPYGYAVQYARFGIGEELQNAQQILEIPERLQRFRAESIRQRSSMVDGAQLQHWLTAPEYAKLRSVS
jgi:hypothetical protein